MLGAFLPIIAGIFSFGFFFPKTTTCKKESTTRIPWHELVISDLTTMKNDPHITHMIIARDETDILRREDNTIVVSQFRLPRKLFLEFKSINEALAFDWKETEIKQLLIR